jgi:peptidylprolyl isomerase
MKLFQLTASVLFGAFLLLAPAFMAPAAAAEKLDPENTLYMDLTYGRVVIKLRPDLAPNHVAQVKKLVRAHFYDNTPFHRVIDGFMAQGGDPTGTGTGGSDLPDLKAEFTNTHFGRGVIGAARSQDPDSANSQFFICLADAGFLDGQYTVWGEVVEGMEFVDKIKKGDPDDNGTVDSPDRIVKMQVAADAK